MVPRAMKAQARGDIPPASDAPRPGPAQGAQRRAREVAAGRGPARPRRIPPRRFEHRHLLHDSAPVPVQGAEECPPDAFATRRLDVRQVGLVERVRENAGYRHQVYVPLGIARGTPQLRRETVRALRRRCASAACAALDASSAMRSEPISGNPR